MRRLAAVLAVVCAFAVGFIAGGLVEANWYPEEDPS